MDPITQWQSRLYGKRSLIVWLTIGDQVMVLITEVEAQRDRAPQAEDPFKFYRLPLFLGIKGVRRGIDKFQNIRLNVACT